MSNEIKKTSDPTFVEYYSTIDKYYDSVTPYYGDRGHGATAEYQLFPGPYGTEPGWFAFEGDGTANVVSITNQNTDGGLSGSFTIISANPKIVIPGIEDIDWDGTIAQAKYRDIAVRETLDNYGFVTGLEPRSRWFLGVVYVVLYTKISIIQ